MNDLMKTPKMTPRIQSTLKHTVEVPEVMYKASGINVNGRRIKSLLFSTDVALIANNNADAILSVYPFTPTNATKKPIPAPIASFNCCTQCPCTYRNDQRIISFS